MRTESVISHKGANAYLSYVVPAKGQIPATNRTYTFWLETLEQGHEMSGSTAQSQTYQHFYARNYVSGPIQLTGRVKTQTNYDVLAEFVRAHQTLMVTTSGGANTGSNTLLSLMILGIPTENLYYTGWINGFEGGAKRFNVAPQFVTSFQVVQDKHSTNDLVIPSYLKRATFTGAFLDGPVYTPPSTTVPNVLPGVTSVAPRGNPGTN